MDMKRDHTEKHRVAICIAQTCGYTVRFLSWMLFVVFLGSHGSFAIAATPPDWESRDYPYVVVNQGVRAVLEQFGRNLSIPVVLADDVDGQVEGRITATSAKNFLGQVCQSQGLAWFYDGSVLYISSQADLQTQSFRLDGVNKSALRSGLDAIQTGEPLGARMIGNTLRAVGPASWLAAVSSLVDGSRVDVQRSRSATVRVFRGRSATEHSVSEKSSNQ